MKDRRLTRRDIRIEDTDGHPLDVSHICHFKLCKNPQHLCLERRDSNLARKHCHTRTLHRDTYITLFTEVGKFIYLIKNVHFNVLFYFSVPSPLLVGLLLILAFLVVFFFHMLTVQFIEFLPSNVSFKFRF